MSFHSSQKKPLTGDVADAAAAAAAAGTAGAASDTPPAGSGGPEEAKANSQGTIESMGIETPQQRSPQVERRPSHWSGSFGGPSDREETRTNVLGYLGKLCKDPDMDKATDLAVTLSTLPFLFIQIPQIIQNFAEPEQMPSAWTGTVSGGMGNLLLCTFFSNGGEWAQARVQAIGAITNIFVVAQMALHPKGPGVPGVPFACVMAIMIIGLIIPLLKAMGKGEKVFGGWLKATTIVGMTVLFFSLTYSIIEDGGALMKEADAASRTCNQTLAKELMASMTNATSGDTAKAEKPDIMIPGLVSVAGLVLSSLLVYFNVVGDSMGGILATMLFMYMPVPQLVKDLVNKVEAAKFNLGFIYFGTAGNGLGLSRALYTRNYVWLAGSSWGCFVGGVLLSITILIANGTCDVSFLSAGGVALLCSFNAVFLIYSAILFYCTLAWDLRPRPASQREVTLRASESAA